MPNFEVEIVLREKVYVEADSEQEARNRVANQPEYEGQMWEIENVTNLGEG
jgi:DNA-dependent RNA polymerase auxiliary subunit epsilon